MHCRQKRFPLYWEGVQDATGSCCFEWPRHWGCNWARPCLAWCRSSFLRCQWNQPERCISRLHEVTHSKQPGRQLEIEADILVVREKDETPHETAHSALQVKSAMERRGVALYFADLVTYSAYTHYTAALFNHLHRDPPPGYSRCSVSQLVNADKLVWAKLLEENVKPRRSPTGDLPLDTELMRALESYQVSFAFLPPPTASVKKPIGKGSQGDEDSDKHKVWQDQFDKKGKKGKGKGKNSRSNLAMVTSAPYNLEPRTSDLEPRTSNLGPRTSNLEPRTSNLEPRNSNLEPRTSNLEPRTSNLEPRTSNLENLEPRTSDLGPRTSNLPEDQSRLKRKV